MIKRVEHRAYSQERLGALLERHPSDVYVMSVIADELAWHVEVASSFGYAAECLHPGISWPDFDSGLLVIGHTEDIVRIYHHRLLQADPDPSTWEDIVVAHLNMVVKTFGDDPVAWNPGRTPKNVVSKVVSVAQMPFVVMTSILTYYVPIG